MVKTLSKSVLIMFIFDLLAFLISTAIIYNAFELPQSLMIVTVAITTLTGLFTLFLKANYKIREFNITLKNAYLLFEGVLFAHIPAAILLALFTSGIESLKFLTANIFVVFIVLYIYRILFHIYLFKIKKVKNVLILGTNENAKLIANEIIYKKALRMRVAGFVESEDSEIIEDKEFKTYKHDENISKIIKRNDIDIVIISTVKRLEEKKLSKLVFAIPTDVKVYRMAEFYELVTGRFYIDKMSVNALFYDFMNNRSEVYDFCKRTYDIIAALIILTVTFPILLYIAIRVKLTDGGSPIYTQNRVGRGGKTFKAYKLRTMYKNDYVPKQGHIEHTESQDEDDRVIPFCKFVRKARFDEIPQMVNILKGEMSIVGPRAEWEDLVKIYLKEIPYYFARQWVRTGWTGWAQINQGHCVLSDDIAEKLQYDLYYLKHRNVLWEIGILVKAVFLALGGRHG